ncbi:hypothetical protein GCM10023237_10270 [Streptomyces coeruleoprunus]
MCSTDVTVPASGARLTWTFSGLMKMATRVRPSFHGMMLCTTPSAGEMTRPCAISRSGSRKNHSMPAARAVAGTAIALARRERRARTRLRAAVATVGRSHGDAPRARRTPLRLSRCAEVWLWGMEDLRSG